MSAVKFVRLVVAITLISCVQFGATHIVSQEEWDAYKSQFQKDYTASGVTEASARYYYAKNKNQIATHNKYYDRGSRAFKLKLNQFSDRRISTFNDLFPLAIYSTQSFHSPPPAVQEAPGEFNPIVDLGLISSVQDQGTVCSSGWAYAAAKSIELMQAIQTSNMQPAVLSAQNFIDCTGQSRGCRNQVPQAAFDYLTVYGQDLHLASDYANNNKLAEQGVCAPGGTVVTNLAKYSRIEDGNDEQLKQYVAAGYPAVIEFNPTSFEFQHYSEGVFQQPSSVKKGSHFMPVIGYGTDAKSGVDYWLAQNSFGSTWGENGFIRFARTTTKPLLTLAIFPSELA